MATPSEAEKALEAAVTHAAKEQAKATTPEDAAAWQGIINQNMAALEALAAE